MRQAKGPPGEATSATVAAALLLNIRASLNTAAKACLLGPLHAGNRCRQQPKRSCWASLQPPAPPWRACRQGRRARGWSSCAQSCPACRHSCTAWTAACWARCWWTLLLRRGSC